MFKKALLSVFLILPLTLLQACAPLVIAGAAAGSGMMLNDRRHIRTILQDKQIQRQILSRFTSDPVISNSAHVTITVLNGVVLLSGQAPNIAVRDRALSIIQSIPHRKIYDQVTIGRSTSLQTRAEDTLITTKVKTAMFRRYALDSTQIKVTTENHVVYLMGIVEPEQGHLAAQVARRVPGVKKVTKLFEYIQN